MTVDERRRLAALGARTPLALLSMRKASPTAFDGYFGRDRAEHIARELWSHLSESERTALGREPQRVPSLGAVLGPPPRLAPPAYDMARRDQLFEELQALRAQPETQSSRQRAEQLERELGEMLRAR